MSMIKQEIKMKWKCLRTKPDPIYGLPVPRSSHGVSYIRRTKKLYIYGGETDNNSNNNEIIPKIIQQRYGYNNNNHYSKATTTTKLIEQNVSCWECDVSQIQPTFDQSNPKTSKYYVNPNISKQKFTAASSTTNRTNIDTKNEETVLTTQDETDYAIWKCLDPSAMVGTNHASSNAPTTTSLYPPIRLGHAQAVYQDRYIYIFGGRGSGDDHGNFILYNDLWVFDTDTYRWSEVQHNNGGSRNGGSVDNNYRYSNHSTVPSPRYYHSMICIDDALYVYGGCSSTATDITATAARDEQLNNDLYKFDIQHGIWECLSSCDSVTSTLDGRYGHSMIPIHSSSEFAIIGGYVGVHINDGKRYMKDHPHHVHRERKAMTTQKLHNVRPRCNSISVAFPHNGIAVIFGGEVDPRDGNDDNYLESINNDSIKRTFANDLVFIDEKMCYHVETIESPQDLYQQQLKRRRRSNINVNVRNTSATVQNRILQFLPKNLKLAGTTTGTTTTTSKTSTTKADTTTRITSKMITGKWSDEPFVRHIPITPSVLRHQPWPSPRGYMDGDSYEDDDRIGHLFLFGGVTLSSSLSGPTTDDGNNRNNTSEQNQLKRLNDLWKLEIFLCE